MEDSAEVYEILEKEINMYVPKSATLFKKFPELTKKRLDNFQKSGAKYFSDPASKKYKWFKIIEEMTDAAENMFYSNLYKAFAWTCDKVTK